jgi:c(7)-type cytochrome triheme protein
MMKRTDNKSMAIAVIPLVALLASSVPVENAGAANPNTFNRLLKPPSQRNPPPPKDGIHDPAGPGTALLQPPKDAFSLLPKGKSGNYVDWVKALETDKIEPRFDPTDPDAKPILLDLNIVREVKGSMPNVVYPHKQHTEWLDCSNCHPAIFIPQRGANEISMAAILLGEKCGVCHGKVAFPVAECRRCHSQKKGEVTAAKSVGAAGAGAPAPAQEQPAATAAKP